MSNETGADISEADEIWSEEMRKASERQKLEQKRKEQAALLEDYVPADWLLGDA